jgi:hypothetical protein
MRKLLAATLLILTTGTASAAIDGVYNCSVSTQSLQQSIYVAVNSKGSQAVYTVIATSSYNPLYGYGIGTISGSSFSGQTMLGHPFAFTFNDTSLSGTANIVINGSVVTGTASCQKIW